MTARMKIITSTPIRWIEKYCGHLLQRHLLLRNQKVSLGDAELYERKLFCQDKPA
jgi:hypothetical protein